MRGTRWKRFLEFLTTFKVWGKGSELRLAFWATILAGGLFSAHVDQVKRENERAGKKLQLEQEFTDAGMFEGGLVSKQGADKSHVAYLNFEHADAQKHIEYLERCMDGTQALLRQLSTERQSSSVRQAKRHLTEAFQHYANARDARASITTSDASNTFAQWRTRSIDEEVRGNHSLAKANELLK